MWLWSVMPGYAESNSQYWISNMSRLNWATMLIFDIWGDIHRRKKMWSLGPIVCGRIPLIQVWMFLHSFARCLHRFFWNWLITLFWYCTWSWVHKRPKVTRSWFFCGKSSFLVWVQKGTQDFLENGLFL